MKTIELNIQDAVYFADKQYEALKDETVQALATLEEGTGAGNDFLEHGKTIHADTHARCRRHTVFKGADEVRVYYHRLVITLVGKTHLLGETLILVDRIVKLRICVGKLLAVYHQLETLGELRILAMTLRQRRHLYRIIGDESRLNVRTLAFFTEDLINQFTFAHRRVCLYARLFTKRAKLIFDRSDNHTGGASLPADASAKVS